MKKRTLKDQDQKANDFKEVKICYKTLRCYQKKN